MKNIRIGNDITVRWSIMRSDGRPYNLKGRNLILYLITPTSEDEIKDYSISANTIEWTFYGKDQEQFGTYAMTLVENDKKRGMVTVDAIDAFNIVSYANSSIADSSKSLVRSARVNLSSTVDIVQVQPVIPTISKNGTWIINGEDTGISAQGIPGNVIYPTFRVDEKMRLVMNPKGATDIDRFRLENGKLIMLI